MTPFLSRLALILCLAVPARADNVFDAIGTQVDKVFAGAKPAVGLVRVRQDGVQANGSGFFVDSQGTFLTTAALWPGQAAASGAATIDTGAGPQPAKVLGLDRRTGVAVLQAAGTHPFLTLPVDSDAAAIRPSTPVVGVGYPFNLPAAPVFGMVTGLDCRCMNRFFNTTHLRTSLAVSPGQIGGPALDGKGNLVGMMVLAADERKFTYVLPAAALRKVAEDIRAHGRVLHGWVGVGVDPNADGVRITQLFPGTPAAASGLQPGDRVTKIDSRPMARPSDVIDASFFSRVGEPMAVVVDRGGKTLTFTFPVTERPERLPAAPASAPEMPPGVRVVPVSAVSSN